MSKKVDISLVQKLLSLSLYEPTKEVIQRILMEESIRDEAALNRFIFGFKIINVSILIHLINKHIDRYEDIVFLCNELHRGLVHSQTREPILFGDYIVLGSEVQQAMEELEVQIETKTDKWTLMDYIYILRQEIYIEIIHEAEQTLESERDDILRSVLWAGDDIDTNYITFLLSGMFLSFAMGYESQEVLEKHRQLQAAVHVFIENFFETMCGLIKEY